MGTRLSSIRGSPRGREEPEISKPRTDEVELRANQLEFQSQICKLLSRKSPSAGHLRLEIKGQVGKYPFWMSKSNLKVTSDSHREVEYFVINPERSFYPCAPKLPNNLHCCVNKTIRLALTHKKSSISDLKQEHYPEHDIILKCVTKLLLKITIKEDGCHSSQIMFQVYEHHRHVRASRRPSMHMREMKVAKVVFDQKNNMAIMGNEFALVVNQMESDEEHVTDDAHHIAGVYIRTLDTCPSAVMIFNYHEAGSVEEIKLPASVTHSQHYASRLLSKSSKNPFRIKLSRSKAK